MLDDPPARERAIADNVALRGGGGGRACERGAAGAGRLVFLGFSQGAAMAYRAAAEQPAAASPATALVVLGGDVPPELEDRDLSGFPPVLLGRGTQRGVVLGREDGADVELLRGKGVDVARRSASRAGTSGPTSSAAPPASSCDERPAPEDGPLKQKRAPDAGALREVASETEGYWAGGRLGRASGRSVVMSVVMSVVPVSIGSVVMSIPVSVTASVTAVRPVVVVPVATGHHRHHDPGQQQAQHAEVDELLHLSSPLCN